MCFLFYKIPLAERTAFMQALIDISFYQPFLIGGEEFLFKERWYDTNRAILSYFPHIIIPWQFIKESYYGFFLLQSFDDNNDNDYDDDDPHFLTSSSHQYIIHYHNWQTVS